MEEQLWKVLYWTKLASSVVLQRTFYGNLIEKNVGTGRTRFFSWKVVMPLKCLNKLYSVTIARLSKHSMACRMPRYLLGDNVVCWQDRSRERICATDHLPAWDIKGQHLTPKASISKLLWTSQGPSAALNMMQKCVINKISARNTNRGSMLNVSFFLSNKQPELGERSNFFLIFVLNTIKGNLKPQICTLTPVFGVFAKIQGVWHVIPVL